MEHIHIIHIVYREQQSIHDYLHSATDEQFRIQVLAGHACIESHWAIGTITSCHTLCISWQIVQTSQLPLSPSAHSHARIITPQPIMLPWMMLKISLNLLLGLHLQKEIIGCKCMCVCVCACVCVCVCMCVCVYVCREEEERVCGSNTSKHNKFS